ncbi:MAG: shikimate dehydrogenase [Bacteroidaceae bacterium]|nr:shikimate dehydrogenase [Bacteroidaceae bacterium]MDO5482247.1 shikimate dehydrogenase [Bacteroidaceae bacterium]
MDTYGLIGYPLGHSFSRKFFTEKFEKEGIDAQYLNFEIPSIEEFPNTIKNNPTLRGLNVTIPYKQQVMQYLDDISEEAKAIGAVNVVKVGKEGLTGYNSDVIGFVNSIKPLLKSHHKKALILGTGGASKAIRYGLEEKLGIETLFVSRKAHEGIITYKDVTADMLQEYEVIVNCSPVGMFPHANECPSLPYEAMNAAHLLYDLVYNPEETLFMKKGAARGATVKNGLEMLHLQALASWDFWNN